MAGGEGEKSLEQTPTWAVATVCTVFVVASLLVERGIHIFGRYLKRTKQKELYHTLDQIKEELMLLGFISLFLTVFQPKVASLCMPEHLNTFMLPCKYIPPVAEEAAAPATAHRRRLFQATEGVATCSPGNVQVISVEGLHQLHIFIFVMAVVHVLYSCITVLIGILQVHSWKKWEEETRNENYKSVDAAMKTKHKNAGGTFVKSRITYKFLHTSRTGLNLDSYIYSFFRQFGKPIYKADYLCLRLGFIANHQLGPTYDFHSYIRRSMEADFKLVVGISAYLWGFVCLFLLMDIDGWYTYFWMAFIPTILILFVGMKLQQIITDLALEVRGGVQKIDTSVDDLGGHVTEPSHEIVCNPIKPRDDLFWFHNPKLLLYLVHFILFQNAFELAFFFWALFTYGFSSCLVGKRWMILVRLAMGVFVQILCSASTLPLYALVSQLGSNLRETVFQSEATASAIKGWTKKAKKSHRAKGHDHPKEKHFPVDKPLGVIGINKELDAHGHPVDIELPHRNGMKPHPGHGDGVHLKEHQHQHPHHENQHPHPHPHPHPQDGSHTVEISEHLPAAAHDPPRAAASLRSLADVNKLLLAKKRAGEESKPKDDSQQNQH